MSEREKKTKNTKKKWVVLLGAVVCINLVFAGITAEAFFNRGQVIVRCSRQSVSLESGRSPMTIGVSVSPESDSQTPGCGMADCPDSCHQGCLDAKGNCTCAGTEYKTYKTAVSVSSSNPSVALGSYSGGTLIIEPLGPGTATLTVTGTLREWSSGSASVQVTVTGESPKPVEPEKPEPEVPEPEPESPEPDTPKPDPSVPDRPKPDKNPGKEDPFKENSSGAGTKEETKKKDQTEKIKEELKEELQTQITEETPVVTKVPELSPQKSWKVYSLSGVGEDKDEEGQEESPEDSLKPIAGGIGAALLSLGFIWKFVLFKKQI